MGEPRPCTPASRLNRQRRSREAVESIFGSPLSAPASLHGERNVRPCIDLDPRPLSRLAHPSTSTSPSQFSQMLEFHVYLPNRASVELRLSQEKCASLTEQEFVKLVRSESTKCSESGKQRQIVWGDHVYIEDFQGGRVRDRQFTSCHESRTGRVLLLYDGHPDTVHAHSGLWNVTPELQMLAVLPQDYTLFSALADEVDNALQAVFQLEPWKQRRICVNLDHTAGKISIYDTGKGMDGTPENCISKWGTIGSSMNRHSVVEAIGGQPPYLKPNFGMYGFGGIGAGLHLGGTITVSSKTKASQRVAIMHLGRESLTATVKAGSIWKTGGEFRAPTEQELQWSPHGSFTKVEISDLSWKVATWKVEEVQRKLKDYYFPYIQNDEGDGGMTDTPVEIRVNGDDLAGVVGGDVAHSNFYSSRGEPFVITLEFIKHKDPNVSEHTEVGFDKANARITCHYFPINKGKEAIDDILEKLREEDPDFAGDFESFSRRSVRRLGRLLPDAGRVLPDDRSAGRLPFMEPKRYYRANEVNRHCYKRVKAFIDVDAGFVPTTSKMDLVPKHPFTKALLELGLGLQTEDTARKTLRKPAGPVTVAIMRGGAAVRPQDLHTHYTAWLTKQNKKFDTAGAFSNESSSVIIVTEAHHKKELTITKEVFQVVYDITSRGTRWKVDKDAGPIRLKLLRGLPGLNINVTALFVTVECFISDGLTDDLGATKIICRPMEVPEERGSKVVGQNDRFNLGESRVFPIEILFDQKVEKVDESSWQKRLDVTRIKSPAFVELPNYHKVSNPPGYKRAAGHKVRLEEPERDDNEWMASEDSCSVPERSEALAGRSRHHESRIIVPPKQVIREVTNTNEHDKPDEMELQRKKLEKEAESLSRKTTRLESELAQYNRVRKNFQDEMKGYNGKLEELSKAVKLETATTPEATQDQAVEESFSTFECTAKQMAMTISRLGNPPGTHAAAMFLQAKHEQYIGFKDVEDVIGIVALLGTVKDEDLNRALVKFLGIENMLALVCGSESAAACIGVPHSGGALHKNLGLHGFAKSHNLQVSGRFRVIALHDESSFFKGSNGKPAVNSTDPQKLLNIGPISKPGSERLVGSLGYAVNLITLTDKQLEIRVLERYGLRESLFFVLFGYLEVFDTTNNMFRARSSIRTSAVSLDGGLIRARNQFDLASREDPVVWFPAAKQPNAGPKQNNFKLTGTKPLQNPRPAQLSMNIAMAKEREALMRSKECAVKRYNEGGAEAGIAKTMDMLRKVHEKTTQLTEDFLAFSQASEHPGKTGWA